MRRTGLVVAAVVALGLVATLSAAALVRLRQPAAESRSSSCILKPEPVSVMEAKQRLSFPVYSLTADTNATLLSSQYAQGCSGARGLDLEYTDRGALLELVESPAPPPGAPLVQTKLGGAPSGWSTATIGDRQVEVDVTAGGKGLPGGIEEAVWSSGPTLFTLTPHAEEAGGAPAPLTADVVGDVVLHLSKA